MGKKSVILLFLGILFMSFYVVKAQSYNLAMAKPVNVWPQISDNPATYLVDGNDASVFYTYPTAPLNQIEVDLLASYTVDRVLLRGFRGTDTLSIFTIEEDGNKQRALFKGPLPPNKLISFKPTALRKLYLEYKPKNKTAMGELEVYAYEAQPVMVNQCGYNTMAVKRFTAPMAPEGTPFVVVEEGTDQPLFKGNIHSHIGDFSGFNPKGTASYQIIVKGSAIGKSFPFQLAPYLMERVSYKPALAFMLDDRCWYGNTTLFAPTKENAGCPFLGVAWRDSHQFSFELQALINLYFSNPVAFSVERMPLEGQYRGLSVQLPAETPEIVRLIYYAVDIYLRGKVNHTLLKEQLAYFLYAYPDLSQYIPRQVYEKARDYLFTIWGNADNSRWRWHDIEHDANLFQTYTLIGTGKGQFPPGHSIIPNLMMHEVAKREGRKDAQRYLDAAIKQTDWLIKHLDWNDPATTKGQRMNEYVTMQALSYFLRFYPKQAPKGLYEKIVSWTKVAISRADNLWDFRKYASNKWVIPDIKPATDPAFNPNGSFNEPGNIAGFPTAALTAKAVLQDPALRERLEELAVTHIDNVFGRNPTGRHYSFDAVNDFEGADLGWFQELEGGAGMLQTVRGVLDGSPKEGTYPYEPYAGDPGHTEGWVTFNTAWMEAIAYRNYDLTRLEIFDASFQRQVDKSSKAKEIGIELTAPVNLDPTIQEHAVVYLHKGKEQMTINLEEQGQDGLTFRGTLNLSNLPFAVRKGDVLQVSYGLGPFRKEARLKVE